jgi:ribonuclease HI
VGDKATRTMPKAAHRTCPSQGNPTINITCWNAGGYTSAKKILFNKEHLHPNNIDVFAIIEAGVVSDGGNLPLANHPGYRMFFLPRAPGRPKTSGMLLGVKRKFTVSFEILKRGDVNNTLEATLLTIWKRAVKTRLIVIYNPPSNHPEILNQLEIDDSTLIIGDFNAPNTAWGYKTTTNIGAEVEDFINTSPICLINDPLSTGTYTHYNGSMTNPDLAMVHVNLFPHTKLNVHAGPTRRDHNILNIFRELDIVKVKKNPPRSTWNFKKANWEEYERLTDKLLQPNMVDGNVDKANNNFVLAVQKASKALIPRGKVKDYKPYWNPKLERLKRLRDRAEARVKSSHSMDDMNAYKAAQHNLEKEADESANRAYRKYLAQLDYRSSSSQTHAFFSKICGKDSDRTDACDPIHQGGSVLTTEQEKAEAFCKHYVQVSGTKPGRIPASKKEKITFISSHQSYYDAPFSEVELKHALRKMKNRKSPRPDKIHNEMLKHLGPVAMKTLLKLINLSWSTHVPAAWRKSELTPILKKGKINTAISSYRPIALTSNLAKLAERMVTHRLMDYVERHSLLAEEQAGFRRHRSTTDQVASFAQLVKEGINRDEVTLAAFVDFQNAFDKLWREMLLHLMKLLPIPNNIRRWIKSFLSQTMVRVRMGKTVSKYRQTKIGVPQGSVLGPALFIIFINDLISKLKTVNGVKARLFADDLIILVTGKAKKAQEKLILQNKLNKALDKLNTWTKDTGLPVNKDKTTFDIYTTQQLRTVKPEDFNITIGAQRIHHLQNPVYLGITLDKKLTGKLHIEASRQRASRRLNLLKRVQTVKWGSDQDTLKHTYTAFIRPVLEYGSEVFIGSTDDTFKPLDIIQNQALRLISGGVKTTPIRAMEVKTSVPPLQARRESSAMILHEKLIRLDPSWNRMVESPKIQHTTFIEKVKSLKASYIPKIHKRARQGFSNSRLSFLNNHIEAYNTLPPLNSPHNTSDSNNVTQVTKYLNSKYPQPTWLHVYTDGSATPGIGNAGAGWYCIKFEGCYPVGKAASSLTAEITAITYAMRMANDNHISQHMVVITDSREAINIITSSQENDSTTLECRDAIARHQAVANVVLQWVPSHQEIVGNEKAHYLARMAAVPNQPTLPRSISYCDVKSHIKNVIKQSVENTWAVHATNKPWAVFLNENRTTKHRQVTRRPRATEVASFRLITGHDLLGKHLKRLNLKDSATCQLCETGEQDRAHLLTCAALSDVRDQLPIGMDRLDKESALYWAARERMN